MLYGIEGAQLNTKDGWLEKKRFILCDTKPIGKIHGEYYYRGSQTVSLETYLGSTSSSVSSSFLEILSAIGTERRDLRDYGEVEPEILDEKVKDIRDRLVLMVDDLGRTLSKFVD